MILSLFTVYYVSASWGQRSGVFFETETTGGGAMAMMETEQDKALKALQISIQMELDGKQYYLKASQESGNELGKRLLQSLAAEEDVHRQKFEQIYNAIRNKKAWPATDFQPDGGKKLRTIFVQATGEIGSKIKAPATELDAVQTAMDMENETYDFYTRQAEQATYDTERDFYNTLASEEKEHHLVLLDYYQYLNDPAAWFVNKEHPSLDGG
jgi:rubrerythrin